ncbi:interleukin-17 receptor E [Alligator mississippiensis]|uniref:interleukin-17 receptor E n=1 Tax=Alligator mississippiensis TaxID=8496 RepID=UPI0028775E9F|nr:interleukin-17 receptor E [Alligator mississippiensis]
MGRPAGSAALPAPLLLLPLLLAAAPRPDPAAPRLRVAANFDCRASVDHTLPRPRCRRGLPNEPLLPPPALALSTAQLCPNRQDCQPCVRVRLALHASGLGGVRGLQLHFLELGSNRAGWLQVWRRRQAAGSALWQVQFDCYPVESGRRVLVSLGTVPDRGLSLNQTLLVATEPAGPTFSYEWLPAARAIAVSVPEGPALMVRLCHQLTLECEELHRPFHQQVLVHGGHRAVLPYEFLLPCLCIEASWLHRDGLRTKRCPFQDHPAAYGAELWVSVQFHDYSANGRDQMAMALSARCPLRATAALCWKERDASPTACHDVPNSTATEDEQTYTLEEVDVHPQLCFKFSYANSSHVECPHWKDTAWNVSMSLWPLQLLLHFTSSIPAAFSAALCQQRAGRCDPAAPIYTVTHAEGSRPGELVLLLPVQILGSCVLRSLCPQVWRSDVRFARKQLLCPDVSHRRFGLLALGLVLALVLLAAVLLWSCRRLCKLPPAVPGQRPVLLVYSPDSEQHRRLVCALADLLHAGLGCDVRLDLWDTRHVGQLGALPWLHAQREHVGRERGTVLLLWSRGSARLYRLWRAGARGCEPADLFSAAMGCLLGELQQAPGAGAPGDWVLAYFSELCNRRDVPRALRPLPCYRLPQELPSLARVLQGRPLPHGWLQVGAKALVCQLLASEVSQGLRGHLELCRQLQPKAAPAVPWRPGGS